MSSNIKNYLGIAGIIAVLLIAYAAVNFAGAFGRMSPPSATFSVQGDGKVVVVPDIARFSYSVITEANNKDIGKLQDDNAKKGNAIIDFLKKNGIAAKDIKTEGYNISPRYQYYECGPVYPLSKTTEPRVCPPAEIVGYSVTQSVSVKVRDFKKISDLLAGVANLGANNLSSLSFEMEDPDEPRNQARAEAIKEAREKAEEVAKAGGFRLGRLIEVSESGLEQPFYRGAYDMTLQSNAKEVAATAPSVEPGSQDVEVTVTLRYEIK